MKKSLSLLITAMMLCISLCSCTQNTTAAKDEMYALDTVIDFTVYGDKANEAITAAKAEITRLDSLFSISSADSDIYKINHRTAPSVTVSNETAALLKQAVDVSKSTNGAFDISIFPIVSLWGFDTKEYTVPSKSDIESTMKSVDYTKIGISGNTVTLPDDMRLDLGGVAKGYIADKAAQIMSAYGVSAVINLGGNVRTVAKKPDNSLWRTGIMSPSSQDSFAIIEMEECSVVTSGAYQRNFEKDGVMYHHIIDPSTGFPSVSNISSATVIGRNGALCDALSTAFFVMGVDSAREYVKLHADIDFVILDKSEKTVYVTKNISDNFSLSDKYANIKTVIV